VCDTDTFLYGSINFLLRGRRESVTYCWKRNRNIQKWTSSSSKCTYSSMAYRSLKTKTLRCLDTHAASHPDERTSPALLRKYQASEQPVTYRPHKLTTTLPICN